MRPSRLPRWTTLRRLDIELLLVAVLCAFALWPLLEHPGLARGHDTLFHLHRAAELDRAWSNGLLIPRWAESFYFGYGSPVFQYYASLVYALACLVARALALDMVDAFRVLLLIMPPAAGVGMYLFARERGGRLAGTIAALAYVYSPYLLYREPHVRGDYPELLAFALFPWLMWRFERLLIGGRARDVAPAALLLTLLTLSHNLMALALTGVLFAWLAWGGMVGAVNRRRLGLALLTAGLGMLLSAWFWLPILVERGEVQLDNLVGIPSLDYRNSFVTVRELLAFSQRTDDALIEGLIQYANLGVAQWVLALVAGAAALIALGRGMWRIRSGQPAALSPTTRYALFYALFALLLIGLMLPAAEPVWEALPALEYLQFPWRLLGPVAFLLAALAGTNAAWIERLPGWAGAALVGGIAAAAVGLSAPLLHIIPEWRWLAVDTTLDGYYAEELSRRLPPGTTVTNEFLPRAVHVLPDPTDTLLTDYRDGYPVDKAHRAVLPPGVTLDWLDHGPQHDTWRSVSEQPYHLEVLTFAFGGWTARVDGARVPITPSEPHGLITLPVPAGEHTVRLEMEPGTAHRLGDGLAAAALLGIVALTAALHTVRRQLPTSPHPKSFPHSAGRTDAEISAPLAHRGTAWGMVAGGLAAALILAVVMREGRAWVHSAPGEARLADHQVNYAFGDDLFQLAGYDLSDETPGPGDRLFITLYWIAHRPPPYSYQSFIHLGTGGPPLAQADKVMLWPVGALLRDDYVIRLPETMPPGTYTLSIGLWTCQDRPDGTCPPGDQGRLPVFDAGGTLVGDTAAVQTIPVR